jgi:hypothetical protein
MRRVACVGLAADPTFRHTVVSLAAYGAAPIVIDLVEVSRGGEYRFDFATPETIHFRQRGESIEIDADTPVYCRLIDASAEAPTEGLRRRCRGLYWSVLRALSMPRRGRLVNPPLADRTNSSKFVHQRAVSATAAKHGIALVPTIVTNQPDEARAFIATHRGRVVSKGVSASKTVAAAVTTEDVARLDLARECPVLLQARIFGPDVRVHSVAGDCVAELVVSDAVDYRFAHRRDRGRTVGIDLPSDVTSFVRALHGLLGVAFLGVDFKIAGGTLRWHFLEANSMPAYHGYDRRAGGRISDLLGQYLVGE